MVDITHKNLTLREAVATAIIAVSTPETIAAIRENRVPKGDIFSFSRAAGLLGIKKTSEMIPDCHPIPIEYAAITFDLGEKHIEIRVIVRTIYKTGVEVEAMHGASVAALTIYDMLKPIDKGVFVSEIRLVQKKGGKSDFAEKRREKDLRAVVVVCSDSVARGDKTDSAGERAIEKLKPHHINALNKIIIPDDPEQIRQVALEWTSRNKCDLLLFTGGTGLSPTDHTPDVIRPLLTKEIPGIMENARQYGQQRMPFAMLSRGVAGFIDRTLVITLPGSPGGVGETLDALFPQVLHVFSMLEGKRHD